VEKFTRVQTRIIWQINALSAVTIKKGPTGLMGTECAVQAGYIRRRSGGRAYGASSSELSSSPEHWHNPEDAYLLDSVAPSLPDSVASSSLVSPELFASSLEELSCPAAEDVPGRE
jgi:hypothetical protein